MNSRERVLAVLEGRKPDRIPVDIWLVPELVESFKQYLGVDSEYDIYRKLRVDKIAWLGIPYKGTILRDPNEHQEVNHWGVRFKQVEANEGVEYGEVAFNPLSELSTVEELDAYRWPSPDEYDYVYAAKEAKELASEFVTLGPWISLFEVYCQMRGLEQALMDTVMNPEFLHRALDHIAGIQKEMVRRFLEAAEGAIDLVFISDDMGSQNSLLMSPASFDEFLFPRLKDWCDMVHSYGAKTFFHTDGASEPVIPRLIEAGVDVLNPIQHVCPGMDCLSIKAKYGKALVFHGGVENQRILPFGSAEEVAEETLQCIRELGPDGYIPCSCHFAQAHTPIENILALVRTVQEYEL